VNRAVRVHPSAEIEAGVEIGDGTAIWSDVHVRGPARIGVECIVGEKTYIAYGVEIGDRVKLNAFVYVCTGVTIEDGVMIGAGAVFTNDRYPRATDPDLVELRPSDPDDETRLTLVREGASVGARAVIGCDLEIGRFAMVGMGSVVTRDVPAFHLVVGNPARSIAFVCRCGAPFLRSTRAEAVEVERATCDRCGRAYRVRVGTVSELA
jgi:UDP-2-acetamido-3-amino-2,3-dideoxy-glucuronate N-acetyltransferase